MDALAVYAVTKAARDWSAAGNGPVLIETLTYRYGPHTLSGDDPKRYRSKSEEDEWHKKDPVVRMRKFLESKKLWDDKQEAAWSDEVTKQIDAAMEKVEATPAQKISEFFENEYNDVPASVQAEADKFKAKEAK